MLTEDTIGQVLKRLSDAEVALRKPRAETTLLVGAAFPTSPTSGDLFFRTDLGWLCFFDGTRWLTAHEYTASETRTAIGAGTYVIGPLRQDYSPYITRVARLINVGVTNTGAAFWTITILGANATQAATTTIDVATTAAQTASTWATADSAPSATAVPANKAALDFSLVATGAPSNINTIVVTVHYRLIVP